MWQTEFILCTIWNMFPPCTLSFPPCVDILTCTLPAIWQSLSILDKINSQIRFVLAKFRVRLTQCTFLFDSYSIGLYQQTSSVSHNSSLAISIPSLLITRHNAGPYYVLYKLAVVLVRRLNNRLRPTHHVQTNGLDSSWIAGIPHGNSEILIALRVSEICFFKGTEKAQNSIFSFTENKSHRRNSTKMELHNAFLRAFSCLSPLSTKTSKDLCHFKDGY